MFKRGRLTISPEIIVEQANLLPVKPEKVKASSSMYYVLDDHSVINVTSLPTAKRPHRADTDVVMDATMNLHSEADLWDWKRVEAERTRGMQIAMLMAGLDQLDQEFTGERQKRTGAILEPVFCRSTSLDYDYYGPFQRDVAA